MMDNTGFYDKTRLGSENGASRSKESSPAEAVKRALERASVSALVFGRLKEEDLNLREMSVEQWKRIERDVVELILAEAYPGEEAPEDLLTFTALAKSIAFMSSFIESVNSALDGEGESGGSASSADGEKDEGSGASGTKFEL